MPKVRNMYIGSNQIKQPYLGSTPLKAVYLGSNMVWGDVTNRIYVIDGRQSSHAYKFYWQPNGSSYITYNSYTGNTLTDTTLNNFSYVEVNQNIIDGSYWSMELSFYGVNRWEAGFIVCYYGQYSSGMQLPNSFSKYVVLVKTPNTNDDTTNDNNRKYTYTGKLFNNPLSLIEGNHYIFYTKSYSLSFKIPKYYLYIEKTEYSTSQFTVKISDLKMQYNGTWYNASSPCICNSQAYNHTGITNNYAYFNSSVTPYNRVFISCKIELNKCPKDRFRIFFGLYNSDTNFDDTTLCSNNFIYARTSLTTGNTYKWEPQFYLELTKPITDSSNLYLQIYCNEVYFVA